MGEERRRRPRTRCEAHPGRKGTHAFGKRTGVCTAELERAHQGVRWDGWDVHREPLWQGMC
jgi:hypothetical protein